MNDRFASTLPTRLLLVLLSCCCSPVCVSNRIVAAAEPTGIEPSALDRSVQWLLSQQSVDGGWHSRTYADLQDGVETTSLVLYALAFSKIRSAPRASNAARRGIVFLSRMFDAEFAADDPSITRMHETYAIALTLSAWDPRFGEDAHGLDQRLADRLIRTQQVGANGWPVQRPTLGGWGPTANPNLDSMGASANVSVTSFALEGLESAKRLRPELRQNALQFLDRCQNGPGDGLDAGGFMFTPVCGDPLNKAGTFLNRIGERRAHSYCSATADGIVSRLICLVSKPDSNTASALQWLKRDLTTDRGENGNGNGNGSNDADLLDGLAFYQSAALARLLRRCPDSQLRASLANQVNALSANHRTDGSWMSPHPWMRENDPLIATSLAIIALSESALPENNLPSRESPTDRVEIKGPIR